MATGTWTGGANDGNFMTAANWTGLGGAAPANSDTLIVGYGEQNIIAGVTGLTGVTLRFTAGFGGTVGGTSGLTFGSITSLTYAGTGATANFGCAGTVTAASFHHGGAATVTLSSGTWTLLTNSSGQMNIEAATVVTTFQNASGNVFIGYNSTVITTLTNAGIVTCHRSITTANLELGSLIHKDNGTTNYTLCTTANVHNGATYNKQSGGTDVTVNAFPGSTFTIVGTSGGSAGSVTVTNLNEWVGSKIRDVVPGLTLTVTTRTAVGADGSGQDI